MIDHKWREAERFTNAEKITEWDGPVYCDQTDTYYASVLEFLDQVADEDTQYGYVWTCESEPFVMVDCNDVIEMAAADAYENFDTDQLKGVEEMNDALVAFREANKHLVNWSPNFKKAVLIKKEP